MPTRTGAFLKITRHVPENATLTFDDVEFPQKHQRK